jgi:hypothetical protein
VTKSEKKRERERERGKMFTSTVVYYSCCTAHGVAIVSGSIISIIWVARV